MKAGWGRAGSVGGSAAVFHVVLRGSRTEALVRNQDDWQKMMQSIESMLFWCGGRVFGCRCAANCLELAIAPANVGLGQMLRYVTVPFALYSNRTGGRSGRVFCPARVYRVQAAFRTEFVLWLHRPLAGAGWSADEAYLQAGSMPWVDPVPVLEELGRGPGARRQYRVLRARGIEPELAAAFGSPRDTLPHIHAAVRPAVAEPKGRQGDLLRRVVTSVSRQESVPEAELAGRSRARPLCRARCLVTLVAVRCGVSLSLIATRLGRDGSTLEEAVLRMRARDREGLRRAVEASIAALHIGASEGGERTEPQIGQEAGRSSMAGLGRDDPDPSQGDE